MAIEKYKATINFDTKDNHPDEPNATGLSFSDTYTFDTNYFDTSGDGVEEFVGGDLMLVAGGGYDTDTITNTKITIERI